MRLDDEDKRILCAIARDSVVAAVSGGRYEPPVQERPALGETRGCFVTLKTNGMLRGCIGCFTSQQPLYLTVAEYAAHSALDDPRFVQFRLQQFELDVLQIEISALTPLETATDPANIVLGADGIYVSKGGRSGCFLPQVATEMGWSVEQFWGHCCLEKAGLDWDAWRDPGTTVMKFSAEVFSC